VSPNRLGTAITLAASIQVPSLAFYECKDAIKDKLLNLQMTAGIKYSADDRGTEMNLSITSEQTLAPNYNEATQIEGFLASLVTVGECLVNSGYRGIGAEDSVSRL